MHRLLEKVCADFGLDSIALLEKNEDEWTRIACVGGHPCGVPDEADVDILVTDELHLALRGAALPAADRRVLEAAAGQAALALRHQRMAAPHRLGFVLFIGAAMSVTAFPVLARILKDRGMLRTMLGGLALTCAAVDDVLAWCLLAVVVFVSGSGGADQWLIVLGPLYVGLMVWVVRPVLRRFLPAGDSIGAGTLGTMLAGVLVSGAVTEWIGLHFIVTGLKVNLSALGATGLVELGLVLLVAIGGKFGGAFTGARLHGLPARQSAALATLMNTRGLTELIILTVGLQLGVLDQSLYSIMVAMAVITTAMAGPLLRLIYPVSVIERDQAVEQARQPAA
nr:Na+/H+ antiporter [Kibdelosporangium sp. MJ126-NF4]CTQ98890.1 Na+/H+ antiporter [Kibdelosporangium sp. MJ126-NF4]